MPIGQKERAADARVQQKTHAVARFRDGVRAVTNWKLASDYLMNNIS
jgi:hypothetical protein